MQGHSTKSLSCIALFAVALGNVAPQFCNEAFAQEPSAKEHKKAAVLEEVVVTAQRREQSAQDVGVSVTVLSQEQIANANMVNSADLALYTPSLSVNAMFGPENAAFNIRGFSKELRTTATVGVYFADVVAPRGQIIQTSGDGAGPGTMYDLQSIQVLKGPQGTLFGRNTTGGAVIMTPQKPTSEFEGYVEISKGNFDMQQEQAVVNLPLHERFRLRLGVDHKKRDGHLNNITGIGSDKFGDANYLAGRFSMVIDITDNLENYTLINYSHSDTKGYGSKVFTCDPGGLFEALRDGLCEEQLERQEALGSGFYDVVSTVPDPGVELRDRRVINHLTWDVTENITIKNILGYMHLWSVNNQDVFGTQFIDTGPFADPNLEFVHAYSITAKEFPVTNQTTEVAELQIQGTSFQQNLEWQFGIYHENSKPDGFSGNITPSNLYCDLATVATGDPSQYNCFDMLGILPTELFDLFSPGGVTHSALKTEYTNKAVYSQATYAFTDHVKFTLGLRYTKDKTEGYARKTRYKFDLDVIQAPAIIEQAAVQEDEAPTGLVEFQYIPSDEVMLYWKFVRGYRQGSVNIAADAGVDKYNKETVNNIEIGLKSEFEWPVPGRFNIAMFDNDLRNMQLQSGYLSPTAGSTSAVFNAGQARIRGIEFDTFLRLTERLSAAISFSYLGTELLEQDTEGNRHKVAEAAGFFAEETFTSIALPGDNLPFTPEISYTINLDYRLPFPTKIGDVIAGATYAHTGEQSATATNASPYWKIDGFSVLNLNLSWLNILGQPLDLSLFATNVEDEEYVTYRPGTYHGIGFDSQSVGQPRMYGARLKYNF